MKRQLQIPSVQAQVSAAEWDVRVDLAAAYRLVALFGWDDLIFTHISAKVPGEEAFLINPYGLGFDEITASCLVKVDLQGEKLMPSAFEINPAGFLIHGCIHEARKDAGCVLHTHSINGVAVASQKNGLRPITQFAAALLHTLAYHDYEGLALNDDERPRLVQDLGANHCLILRNHGLLTVGETVYEAFNHMFRLEAACMAQLRAMSGGAEVLPIQQPILDMAKAQLEQVRLGSRPGSMAWPALLRRLERSNPGFDQ
jgi:ribulose-5-phosphate 4-epimerase/fuculose-1-phosphate aldolase